MQRGARTKHRRFQVYEHGSATPGCDRLVVSSAKPSPCSQPSAPPVRQARAGLAAFDDCAGESALAAFKKGVELMLAEKAATTSGAAQPLDAEQVVRLGLTHVVSHRPVDESAAFDREVRPGLAIATHTHSGPPVVCPLWQNGCASGRCVESQDRERTLRDCRDLHDRPVVRPDAH